VLEAQESQNVSGDLFGRVNIKAPPRRRFALRMAPMIDMIFLLLIFFLVTARWRPQEDFLPFQLPAAEATDTRIGLPEPLDVHIFATPAGCRVELGRAYTVEIGNDSIDADLAVLAEKMRSCLQAQRRFAGDPVEIICDPDVKWEHLTRVYNLFFGFGLTDITFRMTE
jgi:biopolymer transport protein ExbD